MSAQEGLVGRLRRRSDFFRTLNETTAATIADEAADAITSLESELAEARLERDEAITNGQDRIADLGAELDQAAGFIEIHKAENARLLTVNATLRMALEPFAEFAHDLVNDDGWIGSIGRERISDWLGPTDFRTARAALAGHEQAAITGSDLTDTTSQHCKESDASCVHPVCDCGPTMTAEQMREACVKAALDRGNFQSYARHELSYDCGQPRFDMMNEIVEAIRALPASPGKGGGA